MLLVRRHPSWRSQRGFLAQDHPTSSVKQSEWLTEARGRGNQAVMSAICERLTCVSKHRAALLGVLFTAFIAILSLVYFSTVTPITAGDVAFTLIRTCLL